MVSWHPGPPVRSFQELKPQKITEPQPGTWVFDMGRNFAGVVRLVVSGKPGQKLTLRFAERLNPDGTIYTTNLREARATDTYICRGDGRGNLATAVHVPWLSICGTDWLGIGADGRHDHRRGDFQRYAGRGPLRLVG